MRYVFNPFTGTLDAVMGRVNGWASYGDTLYTDVSPLVLVAGAATPLPNNAGNTIDDYLPDGVTEFYDGTIITPQNEGDYYVFTLRFRAKSSTGSLTHLDFGIDIGGTQGVIFRESLTFTKGSGVYQNYSIVVPFFSGATFIANGGIVKVTSNTGSVSMSEIFYQIVRVSTP